MFREVQTASADWADKTLSMLRSENLEACEKRLEGLFDLRLFDEKTNDDIAETIFSESLYCFDLKMRQEKLHTVEALKNSVIGLYPALLATLSENEHDLLVRIILNGGKVRITDWNDLLPTEFLVRRLICSVKRSGDTYIVEMPHQLMSAAVLFLASEKHVSVRTIITDFIDRIEMTLYLNGFLYADLPETDLLKCVSSSGLSGCSSFLIRLFILTSFDCCLDKNGRLIIIHPANAEPLKLLQKGLPFSNLKFLDQNELNSVCSSLDAVEIPLMDHMAGALVDFVRPEIQAKDAAEDLLFLAKQDVPENELLFVLRSLLHSPVTDAMLTALHEIYLRTPRWISYSMKLEN